MIKKFHEANGWTTSGYLPLYDILKEILMTQVKDGKRCLTTTMFYNCFKDKYETCGKIMRTYDNNGDILWCHINCDIKSIGDHYVDMNDCDLLVGFRYIDDADELEACTLVDIYDIRVAKFHPDAESPYAYPGTSLSKLSDVKGVSVSTSTDYLSDKIYYHFDIILNDGRVLKLKADNVLLTDHDLPMMKLLNQKVDTSIQSMYESFLTIPLVLKYSLARRTA